MTPAAPQLGLDGRQQILGIAVDLIEVAVAGHPERVVGDHLHAGEQRLQVQRDHVLQRHIALALDERDETREHRRDLDAGEALLVALGVADHDSEVQREVRDVREGMAWIDCQRGQHRKDLLAEDRMKLAELFLGHLVGAHDHDPCLRQVRNELAVKDRDLSIDQLLNPSPDRSQLLERRHPIGRGGRDSRQHLFLETGHPNLEEVIEVLAEDRQEANPLQEGDFGVLRHGQNALVEVQPGQLPVEVPGRLRDRIRACLIRVRLDPHHHVTNISGWRARVGYGAVKWALLADLAGCPTGPTVAELLAITQAVSFPEPTYDQ